jgi:hypothetical protein
MEAGQRMADTVNLHMVAASDRMEAVGKWCVFHLDDGRSDGVLYDTKDDAVRAMKGRSKDHCYLEITPDGITANDALRFLRINRHPFIDTTAPVHVINPTIFPHMSNLTPQQRQTVKQNAERARKDAS